MRYALLLVVLVACRDSTGVDKRPGTVFFRMEAASCTYTGPVTFIIENEDVGTEALPPGATSVGYESPASSSYPQSGKPVVQAQVRGYTSSYFTTPVTLWTYRTNIVVPDGGSVTHTFSC